MRVSLLGKAPSTVALVPASGMQSFTTCASRVQSKDDLRSQIHQQDGLRSMGYSIKNALTVGDLVTFFIM